MKKSGLADSPFFAPVEPKKEAPTPPPVAVSVKKERPEKRVKPVTKTKKVVQLGNSDTMIPSNHDTTVSRYQDTTPPRVHGVIIDLVRKAVKDFGKEAATHRFTVAEKKELADLIYTYKNRGIKTNENVITRIAVNFIFEDYRENGENSVLNKILEALSE